MLLAVKGTLWSHNGLTCVYEVIDIIAKRYTAIIELAMSWQLKSEGTPICMYKQMPIRRMTCFLRMLKLLERFPRHEYSSVTNGKTHVNE